MPEPDLTAELDAAEAVVMGRAEAVVTEWGVRRPDLRSGIFSTGADGNSEQMARFLAVDRGTSGVAGGPRPPHRDLRPVGGNDRCLSASQTGTR